jgi:hydrogenase maturation protease
MTTPGTSSSRARVTVAGAGSRLIPCDSVGPRVLELCSGRFGEEVELFECGTTPLSLLDCIRGQELMLIVDACTGVFRSGEVRIMDLEQTHELTGGNGMHQLGPMEALAVARSLYPEKLPQRTVLVMVETEGLSGIELEKVCGRVLTVLDRQMEGWRSSRPRTSGQVLSRQQGGA